MQLPLNLSDGKTQTLIHVPTDRLRISQYNERNTRPDSDIDALAQRMLNNGYELTRAVWAYQQDRHYEVFAGGTRLTAAKRANLPEIPIILHEGFTETEIVRLSTQDNENDEYHRPVPIVDVWLSYKALADAGWTQQQIAEAKGHPKHRSLVSDRIAWANFPHSVLDRFVETLYLIESHAREIGGLSNFDNLVPWLDRETAMLEIIDSVLKGDASKITAATFQKKVANYNRMIEIAEAGCEGMSEIWRERLLARLAEKKVRTQAGVKDEIGRIQSAIAEEKRRAEEEARIAAQEAERERIEAERLERIAKEREVWFAKNAILYLGELEKAGDNIASNSVDLIFTDPPYDEKSIASYGDLALFAERVLKPNGSLICYVGHYALPEVLPLMTPHLRFWWILALEHSGSAARLPGKWVFVHWKPMLWFVKGGRCNQEYVADRIKSQQPDKDLHEWEQHVIEARYYIEQLTEPDERVCDPFCGTGTTLLAAVQTGRRAIGIDKERSQIEKTKDRIDEYYTSIVAANLAGLPTASGS